MWICESYRTETILQSTEISVFDKCEKSLLSSLDLDFTTEWGRTDNGNSKIADTCNCHESCA